MRINAAIEEHLRERGDIAGRGEKSGVARNATHGPGIFVVHFAPNQALAIGGVVSRWARCARAGCAED